MHLNGETHLIVEKHLNVNQRPQREEEEAE